MNFSNKQPVFKNGDLVEGHNISQILMNTKICEGVTGLTFKDCNLTNCELPEDALRVGGVHLQKDLCYHLHPELDLLPVEDEDCRHVTDEIEEGGIIVSRIREDI